MGQIELATYVPNLKFRTIDARPFIWCIIRRKYLHKTPEEMIRQLWVLFLLDQGVSHKKIQAEKQFKVINKFRRFDLLVYNKQNEASILFEFKSFNEVINEQVVAQISLYNLALTAPYLVISNGREHHYGEVDFIKKKYKALCSFDQVLAHI